MTLKQIQCLVTSCFSASVNFSSKFCYSELVSTSNFHKCKEEQIENGGIEHV